jgi:Protein of unknown function (DUF3263)
VTTESTSERYATRREWAREMQQRARAVTISDLDRAILDFANLQFRHSGVERAEIRRRFGWTRTYYFHRLSLVIDSREGQRYAPLTCHRYQRLRLGE